MLKITEVYPEYVFQRLGKNIKISAIDFTRKTYSELESQPVSYVQQLVERATNSKDVKFYQIEYEDVPTEGEE